MLANKIGLIRIIQANQIDLIPRFFFGVFGCRITIGQGTKVNSLLYADDIVLMRTRRAIFAGFWVGREVSEEK